ncbi:MAG: RloB family protein [Candidatus Thiodiazotropha sp. (ex Dulcina madagascariensis)]|nr:RloB family protein [Candidatus Thiodiazotropha sp. (ex Dulcina madagascariensis)]
MGSDDLHGKRKAKAASDLARRKSRRAPYDRVLIVCEGSKTEPYYLRELIDCLELNSANVEIDGSCGSSPITIVDYAKQRYTQEKHKNDAFDRVFCVFDRDTHTTYKQALDKLSRSVPGKVYTAINSVPCFEYWLLSHFVYSTKAYTGAGAKSACSCLINELLRYIPEYSKGAMGLFKNLMGHTEQAIAYSKRALQEAEKNGTDNPITLMHELVEYLKHLKD